MSQHAPQLERQLSHARMALAAEATKLADEGVEPAARRRNPTWRKLSARLAQIQARMKSVASFVAVEQDLQQRKIDKKAAEESAQEPQPKAKKEKKGDEKAKKKDTKESKEKKDKKPKAAKE